jgi:hypothetical protein
MDKYRLPRTFNRNTLERLRPGRSLSAGRVIESVRSRLNRCTMRDPLVSSRGGPMAPWPLRCRSERSDDPAHGYMPRTMRTRAFHYSINRPTRRTHREGYDDVRVVRAIQVNRAATRPRRTVRRYSVNMEDDIDSTTRGYSRPVISESCLTEYTYATSSAASRGLEWLDRW